MSEEAKTEKRPITDEDLKADPSLSDKGFVVGQEYEFPVKDEEEASDGGDAEAKTEKRAVTQEDLDADPKLAEADVKVGDEHEFEVAAE